MVTFSRDEICNPTPCWYIQTPISQEKSTYLLHKLQERCKAVLMFQILIQNCFFINN